MDEDDCKHDDYDERGKDLVMYTYESSSSSDDEEGFQEVPMKRTSRTGTKRRSTSSRQQQPRQLPPLDDSDDSSSSSDDEEDFLDETHDGNTGRHSASSGREEDEEQPQNKETEEEEGTDTEEPSWWGEDDQSSLLPYSSPQEEQLDWPKPDLGPEPSFTWLGVYKTTLPEYLRELRRIEAETGDPSVGFGNAEAEELFVTVEDLRYSVRFKLPSDPKKLDSPKPKRNAFTKWWQKRFRSTPVRRQKVAVLRNLTFFLKPGEMTLVLGSPDCGKDLLFKILANRVHKGKVQGKLLFNGKKPPSSKYHDLVSYITQEDVHLPMLTVKETIQFSHKCRQADASQRTERVDILLQLLQLAHRADNIVGDDFVRGVSGGEKKRVTIGTEVIKLSQLLLLDECTTGLDASAALAVLRVVRALADSGKTVMCALRQPSYEVLSLFDNVIIMAVGEIAYFGPLKRSLAYFRALGYECPPNVNPADFLQEVVDYPHQFISPDIKEMDEDFVPHTPKEFVEEWRTSTFAQNTKDVIHAAHPSELSGSEEPAEKDSTHKKGFTNIRLKDLRMKKNYPISSLDQYSLLQQREFSLWFRDKNSLIARFFRAIITSIILATLFFSLDDTQSDTRSRQGLLFISINYFFFSAFPTIPKTLQGREVFYRQVEDKYYRIPPYLFSIILGEIPILLAEVLLFSTIIYWICGLNNAEGERYLFFVLLMFTTAVTTSNLIRFIALLCPTDIIANTFAPAVNLVLLLFCGFLIYSDSIPPWFIWIYWIDHLRYAYEALIINEFNGLELSCSSDELQPPQDVADGSLFNGTQVCPFTEGDEYLSSLDARTNLSYRWIYLAAMWGIFFVYTFLCYLALRFVRYRKEPPIIPPEQKKKMLAKTMKKVAEQSGGAGCEMSNLSKYYRTVKAADRKRKSNKNAKHSKGKEVAGAARKEQEEGTEMIQDPRQRYQVVNADPVEGSSLRNSLDTEREDTATTTDTPTDGSFKEHNYNNASHATTFTEQTIELHGTATDEETDLSYVDFEEEDSHHQRRERQHLRLRRTGDNLADTRTMPCAGAYLSFRDLCYSVPIRRGIVSQIPLVNKLPCFKENVYWLKLLKEINGYVKPGMALALMGSSGAGKSTLLDVLAKRKTGGRIEGDILLNGRKPDKHLNRTIGYVEQQDIHLPTQTVKEALYFSANLRLPPSVPTKKKKEFAREIMHVLGLWPIANRQIYDTTLEERKRVTIGVELCANPSLLFLDEPTSGLDSIGARKVMGAVKTLAMQGRSIVCTIHQPSQQLFARFTHLLLLRKGGEVVYFGPLHSNSQEGALYDYQEDFGAMLSYFASIGYICPPRRNPADFALEVCSTVGANKEEGKADVRQAFLQSDLRKRTIEKIEKGIVPDDAELLHYRHQYANNFLVQLWYVLKRNFVHYWRRSEIFKLNILRSLVLGLLLGFLYFQQDSDVTGARNISSLLYFILLLNNLLIFRTFSFHLCFLFC
ncbi:ABC2 type transporter superfamily protein, variant 2 [Balamuthia mandrillaris]